MVKILGNATSTLCALISSFRGRIKHHPLLLLLPFKTILKQAGWRDFRSTRQFKKFREGANNDNLVVYFVLVNQNQMFGPPAVRGLAGKAGDNETAKAAFTVQDNFKGMLKERNPSQEFMTRSEAQLRAITCFQEDSFGWVHIYAWHTAAV